MPGTPPRDPPGHERDGRGHRPVPNGPARMDPKEEKPQETLAEKVRRLRERGHDEHVPGADRHANLRHDS